MRLSIRKRLIGTYFLIILITVLVFEFALIWGINNYYLNSVSSTLQNQAELVSKFYNNFLDAGDLYSSAEQIIGNFAQRSFQIQITDKRGRVIADSLNVTSGEVLQTGDVKTALKGGDGKFRGEDVFSGERVISCAAPLKSDGIVVGAVRFTSSLELTYQVISNLIKYLILFGLGLILVVSVISFLLAQTIVSPIEEITCTAGQMAKGNLTVRNKVSNRDEIGVLADSLNEMAEQIQKTEVMKNEFISSISHELRTPLTSIKGWAQTLQGTPPEEREQLHYGLDIISSESDRLSEMVEELLDFSRLESGRMRLYREPVEINKLLRVTYEQMKPRALKQGINYLLELPSEEQVLDLDPQRIKQVLVNLIDNALKFTPSGGEICVAGCKGSGQDFYTITVRDTGCGIPCDEIALIRERFYKGRQNSGDKGTGLGLAICDQLVKLHNGTMEIESEAGDGTVITIALPLTPNEN